eukprot:1391164-Amorphochlora_amoeboformis.AAC.1
MRVEREELRGSIERDRYSYGKEGERKGDEDRHTHTFAHREREREIEIEIEIERVSEVGNKGLLRDDGLVAMELIGLEFMI